MIAPLLLRDCLVFGDEPEGFLGKSLLRVRLLGFCLVGVFGIFSGTLLFLEPPAGTASTSFTFRLVRLVLTFNASFDVWHFMLNCK